MTDAAPTLESLLSSLGPTPTAAAVRRAVKQVRAAALQPTGRPPVRIAVLSSGNLDLAGDFLTVEMWRIGLDAQVRVAPFGQFRQELLAADSELAAFRPDFTLLQLDAEALFGPLADSPLSVSDERRAELLETGLAELDRLAAPFRSAESPVSGRLVLHTFAPPAASPLGPADPTHPAGLGRLFRTLNDRVCRLAEGRPRIAVFDFDAWTADVGRGRRADPRMRFLARRGVADALMPSLCAAWARLVRAGLGLARKVLVLDADNTLWGGIVGEDGPAGLQLGPDAPGNAFVALQHEAAALQRRGVLLALASKNNPDDALGVIRSHPHMVLREADFAATAVNWNDKADNLRRMAAELNLGLDSFVFLDDSPHERSNMRLKLPMVLTPELPAEPADRPDFLRRLGCFDALAVTAEDAGRSAQYAANRQRAKLAEAAGGDTAGILADMRMRVTLADADAFTLARVAQLAARTNQFNLTLRRHTPETVAAMVGSPDWWVLTLSLCDRLGDHGLVGAAIVDRRDPARRRIDTVLMSCRVLGWGVETALLAHLAARSAAEGAAVLVGEFVPGPRNQPAADYYPRHGFTPEPADGDVRRWTLDLRTARLAPPAGLEIVIAEPARRSE